MRRKHIKPADYRTIRGAERLLARMLVKHPYLEGHTRIWEGADDWFNPLYRVQVHVQGKWVFSAKM